MKYVIITLYVMFSITWLCGFVTFEEQHLPRGRDYFIAQHGHIADDYFAYILRCIWNNYYQ